MIINIYAPRMARGSYALGIVTSMVVALTACGGRSDDEPAATGPPQVFDPGPVHVHGLGVNPRDGALFIATHTGLFRAAPGERRARRVAGRSQDTMGFTVLGPDRFLGSGHPDLRENLPPFLGLIRSEDAGNTWEPVSLLGEADFHVLEARGTVVYGYGADYRTQRPLFLVSSDGGRRWQALRPPAALVSLAINPRDAATLVAAGPRALFASRDGGRNWSARSGTTGMLAWPTPDLLYRARADGTIDVSSNTGRTWSGAGKVGGRPAAFEAVTARDLYVALHDGTVKHSNDSGRSWAVRSQP
jgi:hypothetical protein